MKQRNNLALSPSRLSLLARVLPPSGALGDHFHGTHRRAAQAGIIDDLLGDPFALLAQCLAHPFQVMNDAVDLI